MPDEDAPDIELFRTRLLAERDALKEESEGASDDRKAVTLDQQSVGRLSRMDAMQVQAMALATEERRKLALQQIEAALKRMDEDEFGYCVACGEPIPLKRLEVDPTVPRCVACAK